MNHPSLKPLEEEVEAVAQEFLEKVRPIVEARTKIKETNEDLLLLLREVTRKLNDLVTLKNANAEREREVLGLLEHELNR